LFDEVLDIGINLQIDALSREQVLFGLDLINCFFLEPFSPAQKLIGKLIMDLTALESGVVEPVLRPIAVRSRHKDTRFLRTAKAAAAGTCDQLIRGGMRRMKAAEKVFLILNRNKMTLVKDTEAKTILQWRRSSMATREFRSWALAVPGHDILREFEETVKGWSADRAALLGPCE
jgi:hypothetical protein